MCGQCAVGKAFLSSINSAFRKYSNIREIIPQLKTRGTDERSNGKPHFSREERMTEQGGLRTLPRYTGKLRLSWTFHLFQRPLATASTKTGELHHYLGAPLFQSTPCCHKASCSYVRQAALCCRGQSKLTLRRKGQSLHGNLCKGDLLLILPASCTFYSPTATVSSYATTTVTCLT